MPAEEDISNERGENEVEAAFEKERRQKKTMLFSGRPDEAVIRWHESPIFFFHSSNSVDSPAAILYNLHEEEIS